MTTKHKHHELDIDDVSVAQRIAEAVRLRTLGYSYRKIAHEMSVSVKTAHLYVTRELDKIIATIAEDAAQIRQMELLRCDENEERLRGLLESPGTPDEQVRIIGMLLKNSERRAKLTGADAPQQIEVQGNVYRVLDASPDCPAWGEKTTKEEIDGNGADNIDDSQL